jgi:hypothetical protein
MSSLPVRQSPTPRDADVYAGRGAPSRDAGRAAAQAAATEIEAAPDALSTPTPAVTSDGQEGGGNRAAVAALRLARDEADRIADTFDQIVGAQRAVGTVRRLVEQLRDVSVVGLDHTLQPSHRAMLQRQVDRSLGEIDDIVSTTPLDVSTDPPAGDAAPTVPAASMDMAEPSSGFPAIGVEALGIAALDVRSSDDALATMRAVDRALLRLGTVTRSVEGEMARFEQQLDALTSPTAATGETGMTGPTAALTATLFVGQELLARPDDAVAAQGVPLASRVRSLLD